MRLEGTPNPYRDDSGRSHYSFAQVERAKRIAHALGRGPLVLCEPPQG